MSKWSLASASTARRHVRCDPQSDRSEHGTGRSKRANRRHQGFIRQRHGGAVFCIDGSSDMERIQAASCGRPAVRSPKLRLRAKSRARRESTAPCWVPLASTDRPFVPQIHRPYAEPWLPHAPKQLGNAAVGLFELSLRTMGKSAPQHAANPARICPP
jgi:hypothetical protein